MRHKRFFDLPRLKLLPSKSDTEAIKELTASLDSPTEAPRSLRPPLSPRTDFALRTACSLVVESYQPPDIVNEEEDSDVQGIRIGYENVARQPVVERGVEAPLQPLRQVGRRRERSDIDSHEEEQIIRQKLRLGTTMTADTTTSFPERERSQTLPSQSREPVQRHVLEARDEPKAVFGTKPGHKRSASNPVYLPHATQQREVSVRPKSAYRAESLMSDGSTPFTEGTEYGWTGSTAPTTTAITPARTSNRASHALHPEFAHDSEPMFLATNGEWMRLELERHVKAHEEAKAQQDLENQVIASLTAATVSNVKSDDTVQPPASVPRVPARKPVPRSSADSKRSISAPQRIDSVRNTEPRRSESRSRRTPRSESRHELELLRPESRQRSDNPTPRTGDRYEAQPVLVPAAPMPSENASGAASRSRSLSRRLREYIRPGSRDELRGANAHMGQLKSRSMSMESTRSAVSSLAPSHDSTNKRRNWKPFFRRRGSDAGGIEDSTIGTSSSNTRGRPQVRELPQNLKPAINLNRELPPLPSLDQWKPAEPELPRPKHIAALFNNKTQITIDQEQYEFATPPSRSQNPSVDITPSRHPKDSVFGDTPPPAHPQRVSSLRAPRNTHQLPELAIDAFTVPILLDIGPNDGSTSNASTNKPPIASRDHIVNYSRSGLTNGSLARSISQRHPAIPPTALAGNPSYDKHARAASEQQLNFSRKLSSDDYNRTYFTRNPNSAEFKPIIRKDDKPLPGVPNSKPRKQKWWKGNAWQKKEATLVDQVV